MNKENVITHTYTQFFNQKMKLYYLHVEGSMPSELSQTPPKKKKKQIPYDLTYMWTLKQNKKCSWIQRRDGDGGTGWRVKRYKLPVIEEISHGI